MAGDDPPRAGEPIAFQGPQEAVPEIDRMLRDKAWSELARCYDLSESDVDPEALTSGRFFHDPDAGTGHPGTRAWRAPFPPGSRYLDHETIGDRARVEVELAIDQGDGPVQRGISTFWMVRREAGWQLLAGSGDRPRG